MPVRLRKFIGTIIIVTLVIAYALTATTLATVVLDGRSAWAALAYFLLTGLIWIIPAMFIIKWMAGPPADRG
ncbi:DUF2842 domain-containing protein [Martelella mangrovi]|uniref:DUF2842 domain-containing protein n=1 Tax=Martelella mangrovi TaxID=1397477 RepID=A0ABV2IFM8_9HYPH|nr:DUF2842 domain-containing protein [uncultured Martelella sp.]